MTAQARVWQRPDGTLVVHEDSPSYGRDVQWIAGNEQPPSDAVPLRRDVASGGDVATNALHMSSPLRTGRRVGRHLYAQLGSEPSDDDPPVGTVDCPVLAERIVRAVNAAPPIVEQAVSRNVFEGRARDVARALGDAVEDDDVPRWGDVMGRVRELARRPAQPAVTPDTPGAAPTRDVCEWLATEIAEADRISMEAWTAGRPHKATTFDARAETLRDVQDRLGVQA